MNYENKNKNRNKNYGKLIRSKQNWRKDTHRQREREKERKYARARWGSEINKFMTMTRVGIKFNSIKCDIITPVTATTEYIGQKSEKH